MQICQEHNCRYGKAIFYKIREENKCNIPVYCKRNIFHGERPWLWLESDTQLLVRKKIRLNRVCPTVSPLCSADCAAIRASGGGTLTMADSRQQPACLVGLPLRLDNEWSKSLSRNIMGRKPWVTSQNYNFCDSSDNIYDINYIQIQNECNFKKKKNVC